MLYTISMLLYAQIAEVMTGKEKRLICRARGETLLELLNGQDLGMKTS